MDAEHRARRPSHLPSPIHSFMRRARWMAPASLIAAIVVYFAVPDPALSQINGRVTSPPFSAPALHIDVPATTPAAPKQVMMPAPPPMKYVPGMEEGLVATGPVTDEESKDLDAALAAFHEAPLKGGQGSDYDDYAKPLLSYIEAHPQSNWNAALYLNMGLGYYHAGYYSRAFTFYEKAWQLGRNATSPQARLLIDKAVGELAEMHARIGHAKDVEAVLADVGKRPVGGPGTQLLQGAREGLWAFHNTPDTAYLCGPQALKNVLITLKASKKQIKIADDARSGEHGFSLTQLSALADKAKLKYTLIHREAGQPIPVPSIINWNVHHYAAIVGTQNGLYHIQDPTFAMGDGMLVSTKALDAEGSGYYLVPATVMKANPKNGWRVVAAKSEEAKAVYGMGATTIFPTYWTGNTSQGNCPADAADQPADSPSNGDSPGTFPNNGISRAPQSCGISQMTQADVKTFMVGLHLYDTPVGYDPQKGLSNRTALSYNSREAVLPAVPGFSNFGPNWSHGWLGAIQDDPNNPGSQVMNILPGGGGYPDLYYVGSTGEFSINTYDGTQTYRIPTTGAATSYQKRFRDGSMEVYGLSNGATSYPRLMFLTSVVDAQGNTTTINYDSQFRITSITDAMGRSTTFSYTLTGFPLLITQITDPFGRFAQFNYDPVTQQLSSITDPIGITSSYTYSTTETTFISQLTTPYGTSVFSDTLNPGDVGYMSTSRSLTMTDPLGFTDYAYFFQGTNIPASDPAGTVPSAPGFNTTNGYMNWRNTFYWDRHAFVSSGITVDSSGNPTGTENWNTARITHWLHDAGNINQMGRAAESLKQPLENRIWYNYPAQPHSYSNGTFDLASGTARVLDDGTTQLSGVTYDTDFGYPLYVNDALGRTLRYSYASNNIDVTAIAAYTSPVNNYTTIATFGSYVNHKPQTYTGADGQTWHYTWTAAGQVNTVTDPNSGLTTYNYDTTGRLSNIVNADNVTVLKLTYDSADRIQTRTDYSAYPSGSGYVLTYAYDNLDRVTTITYPDGTTDLYDYTFQSGPLMGTPSLELRKHTDRLGRVTTYAYDADRRLTSVTEPLTSTTTRTTNYDYYENGTLKDIIDANGNDTRYAIDVESRPTSKTYQYGTSSAQTETYAYENTTSRLHSVTDALGQVKTFTYAEDDRITAITYTGSVNATPNVTFVWDSFFPRLKSMTDGTGTTNYSYTAIGTNGALKLSSIAGPYSNDTVSLTYDALGRLSGRTVTGGNETFGYDAISRKNSHVTPLGSFTYAYQGESDLTASRSVTNGSTTVSTAWVYDTDTNDWRLININNSGITRSYALSYLISGTHENPYDILKITDTAAAGHPWATRSHTYTYDMSDRLLTGTNGTSPYVYDALDNATTFATTTATYNGFNQIKMFGTKTYAYDNGGNLTSGDGAHTYKWDAENRLIEIDYVGSSVKKSVFTYDGIGHRIADAETTTGGVTTTTRYQWCGSAICQTRDGSDNVLRRDLDEGEFNVTTSQKLIYMPDQLGSVRDVLDGTSGTLVQSYDFNPYGSQNRASGAVPTDYRFAGLFLHTVSGLNLAKYRAQDGGTGRFISRDPIRELGGIDLYAYGLASPTNLIDPDGLCAQPDKKAICQALLASIEAQYTKLMAEINKYDPDTDSIGGIRLPPWKGGGLTKPGGHFRKAEDLQKGLRNRIHKYYDLNCDEDDSQGGGGLGGIPDNIYDAATKPIPSPNYPTPQPSGPFNIPAPEPWGESIPIFE
jgi:RHS repeat-associated protein